MIDIKTIFHEDLKKVDREKLEALASIAIAEDISKNYPMVLDGLNAYDKYLNK